MAYVHTVQYYETDKMGITHHSNYIRWMEEARVEYLARIGCDYAELERMGIISPVIGVTCDYKHTTTFPEKVTIDVSVKEFRGVKLFIGYEMRNSDGELVCTGTTSHAFLDENHRPIKMKTVLPELYETLTQLSVSEPEESEI